MNQPWVWLTVAFAFVVLIIVGVTAHREEAHAGQISGEREMGWGSPFHLAPLPETPQMAGRSAAYRRDGMLAGSSAQEASVCR